MSSEFFVYSAVAIVLVATTVWLGMQLAANPIMLLFVAPAIIIAGWSRSEEDLD